MTHKVFIADDSLTIQKVIKITLANQPYEITDCSSEAELFNNLEKIKPKIIFLDFNLSEKLTGYDLSAKIKKLSPKTKILFLLGTFDTLDEQLFKKSGASDKIVKPFDSNKFISICKQLIKDFQEETSSLKEEKGVDFTQKDELDFPGPVSSQIDDGWTMNSHSTDLPEIEMNTSSSGKSDDLINPLQKEISDWGMSFPGVINSNKSSNDIPELPPVISQISDTFNSARDEIKFPDTTDLDYPSLDLNQSKDISPSVDSTPKSTSSKSQLISIDSFNQAVEPLEIEGNYVEDKTDISNLEAQIKDEVEENLWQVDEFENVKTDQSLKQENITLIRQMNENQSLDTLKPEIEKMVKMYVQEYLDEMFKQKVEKISWEIIPDLAENLIRQELSKISNKLIND